MTTLFLHPVGLDAQVWSGIAGDDDVALDFPGFGSAPSLAEPLSLAALADHVAGTMTGPATVVGMSLGSMVAQHLAIRHPDRVRSLVLCAGAAQSNAAAAKQRAELARTGGMAGILPSTLERWFTSDALLALHHDGVAYVRDRLLRDDPETFAAYWEAMALHHTTAELGGVAVPVTVVAAADDRSVPVAAMQRLADAVPGAVLRVIDGPHLVPLERPDEFRAVLAEHAARLR
jgi:pimeloyl-ACP methyl ester carboxylesterase